MGALVETWLLTLLDVSVKAIFLSLLAALGLYCLRITNRNVHHRVWTAVLLAMLLLPFLTPVTPSIRLPGLDVAILSMNRHLVAARGERDASSFPNRARSPSAPGHSLGGMAAPVVLSNARGEAPTEGVVVDTDAGERASTTHTYPETAESPFGSTPHANVSATLTEPGPTAQMAAWRMALFAVYAVGLVVLLTRLGLGLWAARCVVRRARPIRPIGAGPTPILESDFVRVPLTAGVVHPRILLPTDWSRWSPSMMSSVLQHEQAHIDRNDHLVALLAELNRCVYWFHPLAWLLRKKLATLAEQSCDDQVISTTGDRNGYALHLVNIASRMSVTARRLAPIGMSMARTSQVESRVDAILDTNRPLARQLGWLGRSLLAVMALPIVIITAGLHAGEESRRPPGKDTRNEQTPAEVTRNSSRDFTQGQRPVADQTTNSEPTQANDWSTDVYGDAIPSGAAVRLGTERFRVLDGHESGIAFSRDAKTLVSVTNSGQLRWWESPTGKLQRVANTENLTPHAFAASPDGNNLAILGGRFIEAERRSEHAIQLWDIDSAKRINEIQWESEHACLTLVYTPDGERIITGDSKGTIRLWDLMLKDWLLEYQLPEKEHISALAISPDGQLIAAANGGKLLIWEWLEDEEPKSVDGFKRVSAIAFSPDGNQLAVAMDRYGRGPELVLWHISRNQVLREFRPPVMEALRTEDIKFALDGELLVAPNTHYVVTEKDNAVLLWNVATGQLVHRLRSDNALFTSVAVSHDQALIAAISESEVAMWDLESGERHAEHLVSHTANVTSLRFTPDDAQIVTSSDDGTARIWDVSTGKPERVLRHDYLVRGMSVSPGGKWIVTASHDDTVRLWERSTGNEVYRVAGHGGWGGARAVEFSEDSSRFATWGDNDMYLRVWDVATGKALIDEKIKPGGRDLVANKGQPGMFMIMTHGVLSPDASALLIWTHEGAYLFDTTTGREIKKLNTEKRIEAACFTPDTSKLLFARAASEPTEIILKNGRVRHSAPTKFEFVLMNLNDDSVVWRFEVDGRNGPMTVSPDGKLIAVSARLAQHDVVFLLDAATGKKIAGIPKVNRLAWSSNGRNMAFSRDGQFLAAALRDTTALIWRLSDLGIDN